MGTKEERTAQIYWGGWSEPAKPIDYLVDGVITEKSVSLMAAAPGSLKSWTAVSLCCAISAGALWLGKYAAKQGPALYVDYENSREEFQRRVGKLRTSFSDAFLGYMNPGQNLDSEAFWEGIGESGAKFVVIDTLAAGSPGVDENMKGAADPLLHARRMVNKVGNSVLVLHHRSKHGDGPRGSSAIVGAVDHTILFKGEYGRPQTITDVKCRRGPGIKGLTLEFTDEHGLTIL